MTLKIPISKELIFLMSPGMISIIILLYQLYSQIEERIEVHILLIILFGIPTFLFGWFLLNKKVEFKENIKVRKADRLIQLPFSSFSTLFIFCISSIFLSVGLVMFFENKDISDTLPLLLIGLTVIIITAIIVEHPKIWFSDTLNVQDMVEKFSNVPKENFSTYQDGIFSYKDDLFTIQLEQETKTINWDDITLIRAYKIDQYAIDCIVIEIYLAEILITINDQTVGYMKFMDTAAMKLSNFKTDWFPVVAFPAFETNLTTIYEK